MDYGIVPSDSSTVVRPSTVKTLEAFSIHIYDTGETSPPQEILDWVM